MIQHSNQDGGGRGSLLPIPYQTYVKQLQQVNFLARSYDPLLYISDERLSNKESRRDVCDKAFV